MNTQRMIADVLTMQAREKKSGKSNLKLMEDAGKAIANYILTNIQKGSKITILAGCGNNGGDGFVIARCLSKEYKVSVMLIDGEPKTKEALKNKTLLDTSLIKKYSKQAIIRTDLIIDAVYGFSYHGDLNNTIAKIFDEINSLHKTVYAIDINSGCVANTGYCDPHAIHSTITFALDCYKPFHLLAKEHLMFEQCICLDLHLGKIEATKYLTMDEEQFFTSFPKKTTNAYKNSYGKTCIIGGCFGMAGAVSLNIFGAKTLGAPYIHCALPEEIYDIVAVQHITPVFHPFSSNTVLQVLEPCVTDAKVIAYGSGSAYLNRKNDILDYLMQNSNVPLILDAEAIRLLEHNTWILRFAHAPIILTPHIGEFSCLIHQPVSYIQQHKIECVIQFSQENHVIVILKGPNTVIAFPDGHIYINQSGNQALAQAGSGDLLTGILAGMLTFVSDIQAAVCMAVWLHGHLADIGCEKYSKQNFSLEKYPEIMDSLFHKYDY